MDDITHSLFQLSDESLDAQHTAVRKIATAGSLHPERIVPIVVDELKTATFDFDTIGILADLCY